MMKNTNVRHAIVGAAAALVALLLPRPAGAVEAQIIGFSHSGSGCPQGSVGWLFDAANNTLTVGFDNFSTTLPPGGSKACNLDFLVRLPSNFQISLQRVEYLGYLDTEPSVYGQLRRTYKYGSNASFTWVKDFPYGTVGNFDEVDVFAGWSLCTHQVTVATTARIVLRGQPSGRYLNEMVVDKAQYNTKLVYYFDVRACR